MSKLLVTLFLASSLFSVSVFAQAKDYSNEVVEFLKNSVGKNPSILTLNIKVIDRKDVEKPEGWQAYIISFEGKAKVGNEEKIISQKSIYFVKDGIMATELIDMKTGEKLNDKISPKFKDEFYTKSNLIYGDSNAAHKVAIFSDPLCPFCKSFVPGAIAYMKNYPKDFAVYYYHFPLASLHPASPTICRAAIYLEMQGKKDSLLKIYNLKIDARETNEQTILDIINNTLGTNISIKDIHSIMIENQLKSDEEVASALLVNGTPTVYFDGAKDATKNKYKSVKVH